MQTRRLLEAQLKPYKIAHIFSKSLVYIIFKSFLQALSSLDKHQHTEVFHEIVPGDAVFLHFQ